MKHAADGSHGSQERVSVLSWPRASVLFNSPSYIMAIVAYGCEA